MSSYVPVQQTSNLEVSEATRIPEKIKESAPLYKSYLNPMFEIRLRETPCKALAPHIDNVVIAKTSDTISQVFNSLILNRIQAVPLLDVDTNKYIGFLDMLDIFAWLVNKGNLPTDPELFKGDWRARIQAFEGTTCGALLDQPRKHPWFTLDRDTSLYYAIRFMAEHHAHRVALVDKNGNFSSLLTQHRIVSWLSNIELDWYGEFGLLTMANLEFTNKPVVTVPATYTLSDAFVVMWINKLGSIGLTKASGGLMGVLSVSDLKDLGETAQMYDKLFMSCETFISRKVEGSGLRPLIFATPTSSFKEVLGLFKAHQIHRVYIAEKSSHMPLGVVSCSDVLNLLSTVLQAGGYVATGLPGAIPQEFGGEGVAIITTTETYRM